MQKTPRRFTVTRRFSLCRKHFITITLKTLYVSLLLLLLACCTITKQLSISCWDQLFSLL